MFPYNSISALNSKKPHCASYEMVTCNLFYQTIVDGYGGMCVQMYMFMYVCKCVCVSLFIYFPQFSEVDTVFHFTHDKIS